MTIQEKRSIGFIVSNVLVSACYALYLGLVYRDRFAVAPDDPKLWATVILIYVPLQVLARLLVVIALAVANELAGAGERADLEDEMDKLIDLKSTNFSYYIFGAGILLALGSLALGMSLALFFAILGGGMVLAGLVGDLALLVMYRRGL
jgi:hypothetical protein